ncbi:MULTISPECIES: uL29 family ribosomal protein [Acidithiobacillus]|uniref:hypothetical protein n=1 Tax=Acidithiobacillus ferrivorans TaxID=160808 RepID=UPI001C06B92E|nr:hypothetical protein [Acidithiobacillus ferrivorans]MBU2851162.1 hypothetical protein [Acidithiobacillus ferrivorans]
MTIEERKARLEELEMELARHRAQETFLVERIEFLKSHNNKAAAAHYTMVRAGLVGNGTMTSDEVMEFIEVCGIDTRDEFVVAAILAGNPIHVDGVDVMFRREC